MKRFTVFTNAGLAIVFGVSLGFGLAVLPSVAENSAVAKEKQHETQKEGLRVDDLPKPIPSFMKTIRGVGNRVGKEISKATSKGAKAVKKAVQKDQGERPKKNKR